MVFKGRTIAPTGIQVQIKSNQIMLFKLDNARSIQVQIKSNQIKSNHVV